MARFQTVRTAGRTAGVITVGAVTARRGQSVSGWLDVPARFDPGTRVPVTGVHWMRPGPILALFAGTHGYEYTSILALQRLRPRLDPRRMRGAVILVHMANPPSFYERRIYYGPDQKNLNRVYPGRADGTISDRIAFALTREVIDAATHVADLHCGDGNESLRPYSYWIVSGEPTVDEASKQMALAFGLDHILVDRGRPKDPTRTLYTANTAIRRGKPAITTESGSLGQTDAASVDAQEAGVLSLLASLGIMRAPSVRVAKPLWITRAAVLRSPITGVWQPVVEKMQSVATGTLLGRVCDPFGNVLHEIRAPFAGELLYVIATPPTSAGEPLTCVGRVSEAMPKP